MLLMRYRTGKKRIPAAAAVLLLSLSLPLTAAAETAQVGAAPGAEASQVTQNQSSGSQNQAAQAAETTASVQPAAAETSAGTTSLLWFRNSFLPARLVSVPPQVI